MVSFGLPGLDEAFGDQTPILIDNEPGVDGRPFLLQAAARELDGGGDVVFVTTDRSPGRIVEAMKDYRTSSKGCLTILDGYSALQGIPDPGHRTVEVRELDQFMAQVSKAHKSHPHALFVLDSLNGLNVRAGPQHVLRAAPRLHEVFRRFPGALVSHTHWDDQIDGFLEGFPNRLHLHAVQDRIVTSQYFRVARAAGKEQTSAPILYRSDDGPVRIYVPKILVTGPADAGKTTFVHAVSDHAVSAERGGATVALDRGAIDRNGIQVQIFGTPGQERFDPMIGPILRQAVGVVLVVDSSQPESFARASQMLELAWRQGLHAVVAANKQDLEGALDLQQVEELLQLPDGVPIVGCQATDRARATEVLDGLLQRILHAEVAA